MSAQQAHVLWCVEFDPDTKTCTKEAWLPAPSLLPPLTVLEAGQIAGASLLFLGACWIWKKLGQHTQN